MAIMDNTLFLLLLQSVYFLIPGYFANMAPPIAKKFKFLESLKIPIEGKKKLSDGKGIFGKNKTYRGYIVGIIGGLIGAYLQMFLYRYDFFKLISVPGIDYTSHYIVILLGVLLGFGAITGDLIESFFKRRLNKQPGESLIPWDQIDHVMGAYLFALPVIYFVISWKLFFCSIILTFFLHVMINHLAFYLNIRKEKW